MASKAEDALRVVSDDDGCPAQPPQVGGSPLTQPSAFAHTREQPSADTVEAPIRESAQLVLFLTHDEIAGCEDIIDEFAGAIFTISNSAHYPKMLVHNPGTREQMALRCECNHRRTCPKCERRTDTMAPLEMAS